MSWKDHILSNIFLRNMLADFGLRSDDPEQESFVAYFQFQIGQFRRDFYLHFQKQPFADRYYNEIFNKLYAIKPTRTKEYLTFHYEAYPDKLDFLQFLKQEISVRRRISTRKSHRMKLEIALDWVNSTLEEFQSKSQELIRQEIDQSIRTFQENPSNNTEKLEQLVNDLSEKLVVQYEKLTAAYVTGNIRVSHNKYLQSLIEVFYTLQNLQESGTGSKGQQRLFSSFTGTDLASLLRLHFSDFKDKQLNTVQKEVANVTKDFDTNSERFKRLDKALRDFIFGK